ncbi:MAG: protein-disulfide reductase DsbD domain-containing protein [Pseudomonadota bacterium]
MANGVHRSLVFLVSMIAAIVLLAGARAQDTELASPFIDSGQANSRLVAEAAFAPGRTTWFALDQRLAEHWHVYWKNPGDSGLPLVMNFDLPDGFVVGDIAYPTPERIAVGPLVNFGYEGNPVFLVPVTAPLTMPVGDPIAVDLDASWLICEEVCIPEEANFSLTVPIVEDNSPPSEQVSSPITELFQRARSNLPTELTGQSRYSAQKTVFTLMADLADDIGVIEDAFFFADDEGLIKPSAPQSFQHDGATLTLTGETDFAFPKAAGKPLRGLLKLTTGDGTRSAFALTATVATAPPGSSQVPSIVAPPTIATSNIAILLAMAFVGGVILNIMPCVFPILFIKASSLMAATGQDQATIRAHGWLYTAGVVVTFAMMGGLLLALRAQGEQLGWGFHLQSPFVVLLSAYVLFLVGLNLAGVFEVGASVQGLGQSLTRRKGNSAAFFTGMLAVVVAAPCIGPLLSAPMGAAVLLPPVLGMAIFVVMALGLALPYLLVSLAPALARRLPKPGAWMVRFKQLLSFPVFAAAAYFLWVLTAQTGQAGLAIGFFGALLLGLAAWLFEQTKTGKWSLAGAGLAGLFCVAALIPLASLRPVAAMSSPVGTHGALNASAFDTAEIAKLNAQGTDVFVDFTAAWCVTCQFNKLTVFSSANLARTFVQTDTAFMVADWTVRDPLITAELEKFNRNGVPLYVFYPANGTPKILTLPLTEQAVIKTIAGP